VSSHRGEWGLEPFAKYVRTGRRCPAPPPYGVMSACPKRVNRDARRRLESFLRETESSIERFKEALADASHQAHVAARSGMAKALAFKNNLVDRLKRFVGRGK
jgi:hypothetical protein